MHPPLKDLQKLASTNWDDFESLVGKKAIIKALVVMYRRSGLSYGQIQQKLKIDKSAACRIYLKWHDETVAKKSTQVSI